MQLTLFGTRTAICKDNQSSFILLNGDELRRNGNDGGIVESHAWVGGWDYNLEKAEFEIKIKQDWEVNEIKWI